MQNELLMLPIAIHALRSPTTQRVAKCWLASLIILIVLDVVGRSLLYKAILMISIGGADGIVGEQVVNWIGEKLKIWGAEGWLAWLRAWCWLLPLWIIQVTRTIRDKTIAFRNSSGPNRERLGRPSKDD